MKTHTLTLLAVSAIVAGCTSTGIKPQAEPHRDAARVISNPPNTAHDDAAASREHTETRPSQIRAAFGKTLGDVFDVSSVTPGTNYIAGLSYAFTPTSRVQLLTDYYVQVTPKTHRIYTVFAGGSYKNRDEYDALQLALHEKYQTGRTSGDITQGARNIQAFMSEGNIILVYTDYALRRIADEELLQLKAEKLDKKGL